MKILYSLIWFSRTVAAVTAGTDGKRIGEMSAADDHAANHSQTMTQDSPFKSARNDWHSGYTPSVLMVRRSRASSSDIS
jgi:hypothetical protein